jgi:hypothetical protein
MLDNTSHPQSKTGFETKLLRYHPVLVAIHWVSAALILVALATGAFWPKAAANSSPDKIAQLAAQVALGAAILVLTVGRLVVRNITPMPERATAGHVLLAIRVLRCNHSHGHQRHRNGSNDEPASHRVQRLQRAATRIIFTSSAPDCTWPTAAATNVVWSDPDHKTSQQ